LAQQFPVNGDTAISGESPTYKASQRSPGIAGIGGFKTRLDDFRILLFFNMENHKILDLNSRE